MIGPGAGTKQDRYTAASKIKGTPNPLTSAARIEHALVGQSLMEVIGPRLQGEVSIRISSCDVCLCGHLCGRLCGSMSVSVSVCMSVWVDVCLGRRLSGSTSVWVDVCLGRCLFMWMSV